MTNVDANSLYTALTSVGIHAKRIAGSRMPDDDLGQHSRQDSDDHTTGTGPSLSAGVFGNGLRDVTTTAVPIGPSDRIVDHMPGRDTLAQPTGDERREDFMQRG
jgi:hypothetical protein